MFQAKSNSFHLDGEDDETDHQGVVKRRKLPVMSAFSLSSSPTSTSDVSSLSDHHWHLETPWNFNQDENVSSPQFPNSFDQEWLSPFANYSPIMRHHPSVSSEHLMSALSGVNSTSVSHFDSSSLLIPAAQLTNNQTSSGASFVGPDGSGALSATSSLPSSSSSSSSTVARAHQTESDCTAVAGTRPLSRVCAYCALTNCPKCINSSRQSPPVACHLPDSARAVCSNCATLHKQIQVPLDRVLVVLSQHLDEVQSNLKQLALQSTQRQRNSSKMHSSSHASRSANSLSFGSDSEPSLLLRQIVNRSDTCFASFYSSFNGLARRFELFDSSDSNLWIDSLPYKEIFICDSAASALAIASEFPMLVQRPSASLLPTISGSSEVADFALLRFCAQCNSYQAQYPLFRDGVMHHDAALAAESSSTLASSHKPLHVSHSNKNQSSVQCVPIMIPNFYSVSLCRKGNSSHLKKQRGIRTTGSISTMYIEARSVLSPDQCITFVPSNAPISFQNDRKTNHEAVFQSQQATSLSLAHSPSSDPGPLAIIQLSSSNVHTEITQPSMPTKLIVPIRGFRPFVAFEMLAKYQYATLLEYMKIHSPDPVTDMLSFIRFELIRFISCLLNVAVHQYESKWISEFKAVVFASIHQVSDATSVSAISRSTGLSASDDDTTELISAFAVQFNLTIFNNIGPLVPHGCQSPRSLSSTKGPSNETSMSNENSATPANDASNDPSNTASLLRTLITGSERSPQHSFNLMEVLEGLSKLEKSYGVMINDNLTTNPALFLNHRSAVWLIECSSANPWQLVGFQTNSTVKPNAHSCVLAKSLCHLVQQNSKILDVIHAVQQYEREVSHSLTYLFSPFGVQSPVRVSSLYKYALHLEIVLLHSLSTLSIKCQLAGIHSSIMQHSLSMNLSLESCSTTASSSALDTKTPIPASMLDSAQFSEILLALVQQHSDGSYDISSPDLATIGFKVPLHSIKGLGLPVIVDSAFDGVEMELAQELAASKGIHLDDGLSLTRSSSFVPAAFDESQLLDWTLLANQHLNSDPQIFQTRFSMLQVLSHYSVSTNGILAEMPSSDAAVSSNPRLVDLLKEHANQSKKLFPMRKAKLFVFSGQPSNSFDLRETSALSANSRSSITLARIQYAIQWAQDIEDTISLAFCVSSLACLLTYWLPNHPLAIQVFRKLERECEELLQHYPASMGPSVHRTFFTSCRDHAQIMVAQLNQHARLNLKSLFFLGTVRHCKFGDGRFLDVVVCPLSLCAPALILCEHPSRGVMWSSTAELDLIPSLCADLQCWYSLKDDSMLDCPLGSLQFAYAHHILLNALNVGQYSSAQLLSDVRQRAG